MTTQQGSPRGKAALVLGGLGLVLLGAALGRLIPQASRAAVAPPRDRPAPGALAPPWRDEAVPRAVRKVLEDQQKAWNRGDLEGFMVGYLKSPSLTFCSGRDVRRGWDETLQRYRARYQAKGGEMGRLTFSDLDVSLLRADDLALVRGRWKLDRGKDKLDGLFTLVVWRGPDGWRITHDHTSAGDPPPAKKAPRDG